jgi:hypothetical protein
MADINTQIAERNWSARDVIDMKALISPDDCRVALHFLRSEVRVRDLSKENEIG